MKNKKKGFTIVELVIVIAVIGILSAVLIPTFGGLIAKSNLAADRALVHNINTQLAAAEAIDGKNVTMYEALQDAKDAGYLVANINARSDNELVWDSTIDRFSLLDKDGNVVVGETKASTDKSKLWRIYDNIPTLDKQVYSIYASDRATGNTVVTVSFDAGENTNIKKVTYQNADAAKNVIIRTNGGELVINAPLDTVQHYGAVDSVSIQKVSASSYYERGQAKFVEIANGRVVITNQKDAKIDSFYLSATSDAYDNIILATMAGAELPGVIQRQNVTEPEAGSKKLVLTVQQVGNDGAEQQDKTEELYLDGTGINAYDGDVKKEESAVSAAGQLALEDAENNNVATKTQAKNGATIYDGGIGTEAKPYKIATSEQLRRALGSSSYYVLENDITLDADFRTPLSAYLKLDGQNHTINATNYDVELNAGRYGFFGYYAYGVVLKNVTIQKAVDWNLFTWARTAIKFQNVTLGNFNDVANPILVNGNNECSFVAFVSSNAEFENCTNFYSYVSTQADDGISPFVGGYHFNSAGTISFKDCANYGNVTAAHAGLLLANDQNSSYFDILVDGFDNYGRFIGYKTAGVVGRNTSKAKFYENEELKAEINGLEGKYQILAMDPTLALSENQNGNLVITKATNADVAKYSVSYLAYVRYQRANGETGTIQTNVVFELEPEFGNENQVVTALKKYRMMDLATYQASHVIPDGAVWQHTTRNGCDYYLDAANNILVLKATTDEFGTLTINNVIKPTLSILDADGNMLSATVVLA